MDSEAGISQWLPLSSSQKSLDTICPDGPFLLPEYSFSFFQLRQNCWPWIMKIKISSPRHEWMNPSGCLHPPPPPPPSTPDSVRAGFSLFTQRCPRSERDHDSRYHWCHAIKVMMPMDSDCRWIMSPAPISWLLKVPPENIFPTKHKMIVSRDVSNMSILHPGFTFSFLLLFIMSNYDERENHPHHLTIFKKAVMMMPMDEEKKEEETMTNRHNILIMKFWENEKLVSSPQISLPIVAIPCSECQLITVLYRQSVRREEE